MPRTLINRAITFQVFCDWDNDGSFTTAPTNVFQVGDDISRFVKDATITLGNTDPDSVVAATGKCTIRLDNRTRFFSPANTASPLYGKLVPNVPVLVRATDGVNVWPRFAGFIQNIYPVSGVRAAREASIECTDYLGKLQAHQLSMPVIAGQTGDVLAKTVVNAVINPRYYSKLVYDTAAPSDGDYVVVNGVTFTFRNTVAVANDVLIDTTFRAREVSFENLRKAINGEGGAGTLYHESTTRPDYVIAAMHTSHYQTCLNDSPVRYYRLNEPSGTTMYDYGTNAAHGTYNGSPTLGASGAFSLFDADKAVTLDGTNDYGSVPTLEFYGRSFTVEFWFKPAASPTSNQDLFSIHSAFSNDESFYIRYNDTANGIITANFYGTTQAQSAALVAGTWYHVSVTYDSITTTLTLYMDGVAVDSATGGPFAGTTPTIELGAYTAAGANTAKGDMDDAKIYLTCLSETAIAAHYEDATSGFGVLITTQLPGSLGALTITASGLTTSNIIVTSLDVLPTVTTYETGVETFDYAGDNWSEERTNALSAITEVTQSEQGWFYQDVDGLLYWRNRNYPFVQYAATVSAAFNLDALPTGGVTVDRINNRVVVNYRPRSTVTSGIVAQAKNAVNVPGTSAEIGSEKNYGSFVVSNDRKLVKNGENSKTVDLEFRDAVTGLKMAVTSLVLPLEAGLDWTAGEQASGDNNGYYNNYNYLQMLVQNLGTKARITITNTATGTLKIFGLQIRGTGLAKYEQTQIIREDPTSIAAYSRRVLSINLPLPVQQTYAEALSEYLLTRYNNPVFEIQQISVGNRVNVDGTNVYTLKLGDIVSITDSELCISAVKHQIVGINNTLSVDPSQNDLSFVLRRTDDKLYALWDNATSGLWDIGRWVI